MPTAVSILGQGIVSFPDEMDDEAIDRASKKLYLEGQLAATQAERKPVEARVDVLQNIAEPFVYGATPQGLYDTAGRLLKYAGNVTGAAAEDVLSGATVPTPSGPMPAIRTLQAVRDEPTLPADLGPAQQGLTDVARMAPTLAAGMALQALGVPTPLAFGGPMGATAYAEAKGHGATEGQALSAAAEATAVGMVVPKTAQAGAEAAARGLGVAVERGLLSGRRTLAHKAVEALAGNGAVQLLMEGLSLPEYLAATPEERKNLLIRHMTANTAFLSLDVPNLLAPTASRTQGRIFANVAEVLGDVAKNPQAMEELLRVTDEEAVNKAGEIEAAKTPQETAPVTDVPRETSAQGMPPGSQAAITSPLLPQVPERTQLVRVRQAIQDVAASVGGNLTLISGRFRSAARAIFRPRERVAHFRNLNDLPSVAHEAAHELSAQLWQGMAQAQLPPNVRAELLALGQAAYGNVRPPGGYAEEGWAEFFRHYLTMDDAQTYAPATHDWFTQTVLPGQRQLNGALGVAREQVDRWRQQGLLAQVRAAQTGQPSKVRDAVFKLRRSFGMQGMFEGGLPVRELSRLAAEQAGRPLRPAEDPYQLLKAFRGKAGTMIYQAARVGMVDLWGRPTGGQSLRQALAPVAANRPRDVGVDEWNSRFWDYMYGLQAQEMLARGQNPGISQEQADAVVNTYANPAFDQARNQFRDWNRGILDIVREASPNFRRLADAWEQANPNYVPLARETDVSVDRRDLAGRPSNPAFRRRGSSRRVREIQSQVLLGTEKLLASALREKTMDAMFELAQNVPGLGRFITRVPRDMVERGINVEQIRDQMEALGVDTTNMPVDTLLTYYQAQERPHGLDPVMVRQTPNGPEWFQVDQRLFDAFSGYSAQAVNFFTDLFLYLPSRVFKLGTTGLRPSFGFTTNVMRDLPTFLSQSASGVNPFGRLSAYFRGMGELSLRALTGGRVESESLQAFERSGVLNATFLGGNISHARREARNLHHGAVMRTFLSPVEAVREAISTFESGPRYAEWQRIGRELGANPAQGLTPDQIVRMTNAAKEVTTDFSARGDWGGDPVIGSLVGGMPFANAALQGARAFARTLRDRPLQALMYGTAVYTMPTLWNWWRNKDEPWYRGLPSRERWYYLNVPTKSGQVVQYPKPQEWGSFFSVLPEALFDAAYQSNPKVFTEVFGHIFTTLNPFGLPVLAQEVLEQVANKDFFWDRPIVPEYDRMNLQPGEQVAPYTSSFAKGLGRLMPETVSPRRVDHAVRSILGGAWSDAIAVLDLSEQRERRGREPADLPVVGRIFRRGGEYSPRSRSLENLYDLASYWQSRQTSERFPMTTAEDAYAHVIREHMQVVRTAQQLAEMSNKPEFRREVYRRISGLAEQLVNDARKIKMLPEQKQLPAQVEPVPRIKGL